jgi:very-short-patch-repair endonuclease
MTVSLDEQRKDDEKLIHRALRERQTEQLQSDEQQSAKHSPGGDTGTRLDQQIRIGLARVDRLLSQDKLICQLQRESHQAIEELRRRHQVKRIQLIQEKEYEFLSVLTKAGNYQANDLESAILSAVPPTWSVERRRQLFDRLCAQHKHLTTPSQSSMTTKSKFGIFKRGKTNEEHEPASVAKPSTDGSMILSPPLSSRSSSEVQPSTSKDHPVTRPLSPVRESPQLTLRQNRLSSTLPPRFDRPVTPTRSIIKHDQSRFTPPIVRPSSDRPANNMRSVSYDETDSPLAYQRMASTLPAGLPTYGSSSILPALNSEKKRKTVRLAESHEYYSDYGDWSEM